MATTAPKVVDNVTELIGFTPLCRLNKIPQAEGALATIYAKLESQNPMSSVKDRIAKSMIEGAEKEGLITPGKTTLIEPTSGNTGIAIAFIAAAKGYKTVLVMPDSMSMERRVVLLSLGAKLVLTPAAKGMMGAVLKADDISSGIEDSFILQQFNNPDNPAAHVGSTGPEIWDAMPDVAAFVAGIGTGGTLSGTGAFLHQKNPDITIVGIEPEESNILTGGTPGGHKIQGIGAGFVPKVLDENVYDEVLTVASADAMEFARRIAREEGLFVGISSGAALKAAIEVAKREEFRGKKIVVVFPSFGERYLSSAMFAEHRAEAEALKAE